MRINLNGRQFLAVATLPIAFGFGCSQRSGLDRGDANENVLRSRVTSNAANDSSRDGVGSAELHQFAQAPESSADEGRPEPLAQPAPARQPESPNASASGPAAKSAPRSRSYDAAEASRSDLSARGGTAYSPKSSESVALQRKQERPGLGTSWGETRKSWVSTVDFERANLTAPTAAQRIFYNEAAGILAQTGESSLSAFGPNQTALGRGFVTVEIVDPDGQPLLGLANANQSFVVGRDGERYAIRVRNQERYRVEIVATVDGLDVIDGTRGNFQKRGYVLEPYSTVLIEGFRKSTSAVASFRFGTVSDSYAARTGSDRNVGVIGVALFAERGCCSDEYDAKELRRRETAEPFPGQFARPPQMRGNQY